MFYLDTKTVPRRTSRQLEQRIHENPVRRPRIPSSVQISDIGEQIFVTGIGYRDPCLAGAPGFGVPRLFCADIGPVAQFG